MNKTPRYTEAGKLALVYRKWSSMKQRCINPNHPAWKYYGGAGVRVCERWQSFDAFFADMGHPPSGHWIDRIDNAKGYEPGNCRWVTPKQSGANRRKARRYPVRPNSIRQQALAAGVPYEVVRKRIAWGWQKEQALRVGVMGVGRPKGFDLERLLAESLAVLKPIFTR